MRWSACLNELCECLWEDVAKWGATCSRLLVWNWKRRVSEQIGVGVEEERVGWSLLAADFSLDVLLVLGFYLRQLFGLKFLLRWPVSPLNSLLFKLISRHYYHLIDLWSYRVLMLHQVLSILRTVESFVYHFNSLQFSSLPRKISINLQSYLCVNRNKRTFLRFLARQNTFRTLHATKIHG